MKLLRYLHGNRERPLFGSARWCKVWAKRLITLPTLMQSIGRQAWLRARGASIQDPVFLAPCTFNGDVSNLRVGSNSYVGRVQLHLHDQITIGANVIVNDDVILLTASHDINDPLFSTTRKPIKIKDHVWIATGAIILPGVTIGTGAVVAASSVVTKEVEDYAVVAGNPARRISRRQAVVFDYSPAAMVAAFEAWLGRSNHTHRINENVAAARGDAAKS